jgi:hypothetical protein
MGIPRRDGGGGSFQVNIRPLVKSSPEEQGIADLRLPTGTRLNVTGLWLYPNHDRGLHAAYRKFLVNTRPEVTIVLGNALNEEAFKQVADSQDRMRKLIAPNEVPELRKIRKDHEGLEDKFLALAQLGGEFIADFAEASGGHVFYIPALQASGQMPNEMGLFDFVLSQKEKADSYADRHPEEAIEGPPIPTDFAKFIGLHGHEHVTVMPFGSALRINDNLRFIGADYKRRQPAAASYTDVEHSLESTVRLGDGKVASIWWSTPKHSLGGSHRRWWQAHEVGNMFDLKQLGFLRNYDRRGKGFWSGTVVGDKIFGTAVPVLYGLDKRRGFVLDGVAYDEDTPSAPARKFSLTGVKLRLKATASAPQEDASAKEKGPKAVKKLPAGPTPRKRKPASKRRSGTSGKKKK